ncbi:MAG: hypothetical protein AB9842_08300 [Bacteroidales bacterium]
MITPALFSNKNGSGYIADNPDEIMYAIGLETCQGVTINGKWICPGSFITLDDFFCRPLLFMGLKGDNELIFYIGKEEVDLFGEKYYYQSIFKIDESRIFEMFSPNAGSDFYFKNGKWK